MLRQRPAGAHRRRQQPAMWFQSPPAFEMSPGKIYRQPSCYRPSASTPPVWFLFNLLWVDQFPMKLRALWGPFENRIIKWSKSPIQNSPVFHFANACACVWIHDLHSPSVFFPSRCPFHVPTFQFPLHLFRLRITQPPYAETIRFTLSLALLQLYRCLFLLSFLSPVSNFLSSQPLAYSHGPRQQLPPLHTSLFFHLQSSLYWP